MGPEPKTIEVNGKTPIGFGSGPWRANSNTVKLPFNNELDWKPWTVWMASVRHWSCFSYWKCVCWGELTLLSGSPSWQKSNDLVSIVWSQCTSCSILTDWGSLAGCDWLETLYAKFLLCPVCSPVAVYQDSGGTGCRVSPYFSKPTLGNKMLWPLLGKLLVCCDVKNSGPDP